MIQQPVLGGIFENSKHYNVMDLGVPSSLKARKKERRIRNSNNNALWMHLIMNVNQ
jgi:hypothetical protein